MKDKLLKAWGSGISKKMKKLSEDGYQGMSARGGEGHGDARL